MVCAAPHATAETPQRAEEMMLMSSGCSLRWVSPCPRRLDAALMHIWTLIVDAAAWSWSSILPTCYLSSSTHLVEANPGYPFGAMPVKLLSCGQTIAPSYHATLLAIVSC